MNKHIGIGIVALAILVIAIPIYTRLEPARLNLAQHELRQQFLAEGTELYIENCAICHGTNGEGIGVTPALANPALAQSDPKLLFRTIARAAHGTVMAAWHTEEGGILNDYEVEELVTLIRYGNWQEVNAVAEAQGFTPVSFDSPVDSLTYMVGEGGQVDPHRCVACHEEPAVHADRFGLNCARCHTPQYWKPALLVRHTFLLDHGGEGQVTCQTCHVANYYENSCYGCHDHTVSDMQQVHLAEAIVAYDDCVLCHPTGVEGEAAALGYGTSAQANGAVGLSIPALSLIGPPEQTAKGQ